MNSRIRHSTAIQFTQTHLITQAQTHLITQARTTMFAVVLAVVLAVTFQTAQSSCVSKLTATANLDSKTRNLEVLDMSCGAGEYFHGFRLSWGPGM